MLTLKIISNKRNKKKSGKNIFNDLIFQLYVNANNFLNDELK